MYNMSRILTVVGNTRSFFLIETFPFLSFLTEEMLTTKVFESIVRDFDEGSPVDSVKKEILLDPYSK
jgi:hypothetical protein